MAGEGQEPEGVPAADDHEHGHQRILFITFWWVFFTFRCFRVFAEQWKPDARLFGIGVRQQRLIVWLWVIHFSLRQQWGV